MSEVTLTTLPEEAGGATPLCTMALIWLAALLSAGCAVPVAPTGGPPDRQPPAVDSVEPANGAVNVATSAVRITFNEYITESSLQQALSITPEPQERPELRWSGRTAEIRFRSDPEPNTTYILTIDTRLRDSHGVSLTAPITLAFSTGSEINRGRIQGTVLTPLRGRGAPGTQVFAYPLTESADLDSLPERPLYRTETDASGDFQFEYLSARPYFVLAVRDRNGNRRPDNLETLAVPPVKAILADTAGTRIEHPWITTVLDTVAPEIRRIEAISTSRLTVRYSENIVEAQDPASWTLADTLRQRSFTIRAAYFLPEDPRQIYLQTEPLRLDAYVLIPAAVRDSVGNRATRSPVTLTVGSPPEEGPARFLSFIPLVPREEGPLHPAVPVGVLFDRPVESREVRDWIALEDTTGNALPYSISSPDGVRQLLAVDGADDGIPFQVRVLEDAPVSADSTARRVFSFLTGRQLGGVVGVIDRVGSDTTLVVEAIRSGRSEAAGSAVVDESGHFAIGRLEEGSYTLRITRDDNDNGRWDGGAIAPYTPAEPLFWTPDSLRVRARWDTDVDTLRIPHF